MPRGDAAESPLDTQRLGRYLRRRSCPDESTRGRIHWECADLSSNRRENVTAVIRRRVVKGTIKSSTTVSVTPPSVNEGRRLSRPGHESFTLTFCLATSRCMNLGPSFLEALTPSCRSILRIVLCSSSAVLLNVSPRRRNPEGFAFTIRSTQLTSAPQEIDSISPVPIPSFSRQSG